MYNLYLSLPTLLFSIVCYFFSWKSFKNNQLNLALILTILGGLILRIYSASDLFLHSWDERYHALVAKNLLQHPLLPTLYLAAASRQRRQDQSLGSVQYLRRGWLWLS